MGRYPSGQRGQTVNLMAHAYEGSNPSLPTILRLYIATYRVGFGWQATLMIAGLPAVACYEESLYISEGRLRRTGRMVNHIKISAGLPAEAYFFE